MDTVYEKKSGIERQSEVLIEALERAKQNDGAFLNPTYKLPPHFYGKDLRITPVNALMMAMHSDARNLKSNAYISFKMLQNENSAIRKGQKGVPFTWETQEYVEAARPENKISRAAYFALSPVDKQRYEVRAKEDTYTLFNLDQTTYPFVHKEAYKQHIAAVGGVSERDDKALRMEVNKYIAKVRFNLLPVRKDGIGVALYDNDKDVVHIPAQNAYNSYPEYVQAVGREIAHATGVMGRLNRTSAEAKTPEAQQKESLIKDLVSAHKSLEFGLPSRLSKTTLAAVPALVAEIRSNPSYTQDLFAEVSRAIGMIKKAEKGERVTRVKRTTQDIHLPQEEKEGKKIAPAVFEQLTILKDDNEKWALVARPENGKTFAIYPTKQDISTYFDSLKNPNKEEGVKTRTALAQKYYEVALSHPEMKVDVFKTDAKQENIDKIEKVNIFRSKENKPMLTAYVNKKPLPPVPLNQSIYQRLWLSDDRENYKKALAASFYAERLSKGETTQVQQKQEQGQEKKQTVVQDDNPKNKLTFGSALKEYYENKKEYPDALLLFRDEDKYVLFSSDAKDVHEKLGLLLYECTNVQDKNGEPLALCKFPRSDADKNITQLVKENYRVAILDYAEEKQAVSRPEPVKAEAREEKQQETVTQRSSFHR